MAVKVETWLTFLWRDIVPNTNRLLWNQYQNFISIWYLVFEISVILYNDMQNPIISKSDDISSLFWYSFVLVGVRLPWESDFHVTYCTTSEKLRTLPGTGMPYYSSDMPPPLTSKNYTFWKTHWTQVTGKYTRSQTKTKNTQYQNKCHLLQKFALSHPTKPGCRRQPPHVRDQRICTWQPRS